MDVSDGDYPLEESRAAQELKEVIEDIDFLISMLYSLRWQSLQELQRMEKSEPCSDA